LSSELVDEVRFEAACRLLDNPRTRILAFSDPSNFSHVFLRWSGVSPREYRHRQAAISSRPRDKMQVQVAIPGSSKARGGK
jgi:AraC-like DNA-binding protein